MSLGPPLYSVAMAVPRPWIRSPANRRSVAVRATWWRLAGSGGRADEDGLLTRAAGEQRRLGRRRPRQRLLRPPASHRGRPDGGAMELQGQLYDAGGVGGVDWKRGMARTSAGHRQWDAAARCVRVQNVHSGRAQSMHAKHSAKCQSMLGG